MEDDLLTWDIDFSWEDVGKRSILLNERLGSPVEKRALVFFFTQNLRPTDKAILANKFRRFYSGLKSELEEKFKKLPRAAVERKVLHRDILTCEWLIELMSIIEGGHGSYHD